MYQPTPREDFIESVIKSTAICSGAIVLAVMAPSTVMSLIGIGLAAYHSTRLVRMEEGNLKKPSLPVRLAANAAALIGAGGLYPLGMQLGMLMAFPISALVIGGGVAFLEDAVEAGIKVVQKIQSIETPDCVPPIEAKPEPAVPAPTPEPDAASAPDFNAVAQPENPEDKKRMLHNNAMLYIPAGPEL